MTGFSQPRNRDKQRRKECPGETGRRGWEGRGEPREREHPHSYLRHPLVRRHLGTECRAGPRDCSETVQLACGLVAPAPGTSPPGAPPAPRSPVRLSGPERPTPRLLDWCWEAAEGRRFSGSARPLRGGLGSLELALFVRGPRGRRRARRGRVPRRGAVHRDVSAPGARGWGPPIRVLVPAPPPDGVRGSPNVPAAPNTQSPQINTGCWLWRGSSRQLVWRPPPSIRRPKTPPTTTTEFPESPGRVISPVWAQCPISKNGWGRGSLYALQALLPWQFEILCEIQPSVAQLQGCFSQAAAW